MFKIIYEGKGKEAPPSDTEIKALLEIDIKNFEGLFIKKLRDFRDKAFVHNYHNTKEELEADQDWQKYNKTLGEIISFWTKNFSRSESDYPSGKGLIFSQEMNKIGLYLNILKSFEKALPWTPGSLTQLFNGAEDVLSENNIDH